MFEFMTLMAVAWLGTTVWAVKADGTASTSLLPGVQAVCLFMVYALILVPRITPELGWNAVLASVALSSLSAVAALHFHGVRLQRKANRESLGAG